MWFNGLGTYGPVKPSYLIDGILGTLYSYSYPILPLRVSANIFCNLHSPIYASRNVYIFKNYNRISKLGRKTLTSKISKWYKLVLFGFLLIIFAILSYLNHEGIYNFSILGNDPTVFYASLYFNIIYIIWYLQFVLMPFLGNYSCVNTGLCAWGSFNQFLGYLGLFRLKVRDPKVCKTVDCACPVGIEVLVYKEGGV